MEGIGTLCTGGLLLIGAIIILFLVFRWLSKREKPAGTYDRKDIDSGSSIGGMRGGRAHDSKEFDSGSTIGGDRQRRAYDRPEIKSGASIGGGPRTEDPEQTSSRAAAPSKSSASGWDVQDMGDLRDEEQPEAKEPPKPYETRKSGSRVDTPEIKSGGSFGG